MAALADEERDSLEKSNCFHHCLVQYNSREDIEMNLIFLFIVLLESANDAGLKMYRVRNVTMIFNIQRTTACIFILGQLQHTMSPFG